MNKLSHVRRTGPWWFSCNRHIPGLILERVTYHISSSFLFVPLFPVCLYCLLSNKGTNHSNKTNSKTNKKDTPYWKEEKKADECFCFWFVEVVVVWRVEKNQSSLNRFHGTQLRVTEDKNRHAKLNKIPPWLVLQDFLNVSSHQLSSVSESMFA